MPLPVQVEVATQQSQAHENSAGRNNVNVNQPIQVAVAHENTPGRNLLNDHTQQSQARENSAGRNNVNVNHPIQVPVAHENSPGRNLLNVHTHENSGGRNLLNVNHTRENSTGVHIYAHVSTTLTGESDGGSSGAGSIHETITQVSENNAHLNATNEKTTQVMNAEPRTHTGDSYNEQQSEQPWQQQRHERKRRQRQEPPRRSNLHISSNGKMKSMLVSDSTCRNIGFRDINSSIKQSEEEVTITKHPGATTSELHHISRFHIDKEKPDNIIIVSGLNDILNQKRRQGTVDCRDIANQLVEMGRTAREKGVGRVCISGILIPKFRDCQQFVIETNDIISELCADNSFIFINHDNIGTNDLIDSLHVNREGNVKLKHNIFSHLYTYNNPY